VFSDGKRSRSLVAVGALILFAAISVLTSDWKWANDRGPRVTIVNDLSQRVTISQFRDGAERSMARNEGGDRLDPGEERGFSIAAGPDPSRAKLCDSVEFVAKSDAGEVVARVGPPLCMDDRVLLSGRDASPQTSP
jgi:hypothetical protein